MITGKLISYIAGLSFLLLAAVSATTFVKEYRSYQILENWGIGDILEIEVPESLSALSLQSDYYLIDFCMQSITSIEGLVLSGHDRKALIEKCDAVFASILVTSKQNAYAWYARAYIAIERDQAEGMSLYLEKSYASGSSEQWVSELRVSLAERALDFLSEKALLGHEKDLELLVQSNRGIRTIVDRYVADEAFRSRITRIVEGLPHATQVRFVGSLKRAVAELTHDR